MVFTNWLVAPPSARNRLLENGSGVAVGDCDGDDRPDLVLCSLEGSNALYRNLGDWTLADATEPAGLGATNHVDRGATFAAIDGDR